MIEQIRQITTWKTIQVEQSGLRKRTLKVCKQHITLLGYTDGKTGQAKTIRQIILGYVLDSIDHGRKDRKILTFYDL